MNNVLLVGRGSSVIRDWGQSHDFWIRAHHVIVYIMHLQMKRNINQTIIYSADKREI